jgi:hypothetical protein
MGQLDRPRNLDEEGRAVVERLGGRWTPAGGICRCPAHDDRSPSLSVRPGRSRLLLHCFAGCAPSDILRLLQTAGVVGPGPNARSDNPAQPRGSYRAAAHRLWIESRPIARTIAEEYLLGRGVMTASPQLRYHPRTPFGPSPPCYRPALIAAIRDESGLVAIQRTALHPRPGGLPPVAGDKRGLGRFGAGSVRIGGAAAIIGLAEGIETALSASALFGIPCWATLGTERFGRVALPGQVEQLHLFLDHDAGGRRGEQLAREAFASLRHVEAHFPPRPGQDWNDVIRELASHPMHRAGTRIIAP